MSEVLTLAQSPPASRGEAAGAASERTSPLVLRLEEYAHLAPEARAALERLTAKAPRTIRARRDLIRHGDNPKHIYLINRGWGCRYKTLVNGRRQIIDFLIPGDLCELNVYILSRIDHSVGAISDLQVIEIGRDEFEAVTNEQPQITLALWWQELVNKSCHREWIVNVGARSAFERIAHLLCELFLRLESIGGTDGYRCHFPLTQVDIADATGLTPIHVNRTLQKLRAEKLIVLEGRTLTIADMSALKAAGLFNPDYLHLERLRRHRNAKGPVEV